MKKCKYCKSEINSKAKICPNCRKKQGKISAKVCLLILIMGIIIISSYKSLNKKNKKLFLEEGYTYGYDDIGFAFYIEGYVNNPTNKDYNYVQVIFTTYDKDGNTLSSCDDKINYLKKDEKWKFKAVCLGTEKKIAEVKLKEIIGW